MTIAALQKVLICGRQVDKAAALAGLQALGAMHLLPLTVDPPEPEHAETGTADEAWKALRFLRETSVRRRPVSRDESFDVERFVREVLTLKQDLRETNDRRDAILARLQQNMPWGDISFPPHDDLAGLRLWFYQLPIGNRPALDTLTLPWQIVGRDTRFLYVVVLSETEPEAGLLPVPRTHFGALSQTQLAEALEECEIRLETLQADRAAMTRYLGLLASNIAAAETAAEFRYAAQQTFDDEALFAVEGWVPEERMGEVATLAEELGLALEAAAPGPDDLPPTLLLQPEERSAGVALANFYQVPGYGAWDPTQVVVLSFAIFFAMIVADAGYGAVIALGLMLYRKTLAGSPVLRSWRRLGWILAWSTMIYGVLVGSYFGAPPPEGTVLAEVQAFDLTDFDTMMALSVGVGALHVSYGILRGSLAKRGVRSAAAGYGWIAAIWGSVGLCLLGTTGFVGLASMSLIVGGLAGIVWFSSDRPVRRPLDWALRLFDGVQALGGIMGAFGDVLSYMRLFALGLASASLALTFNQLAAEVRGAEPGMGVLLSLLILAIGHTLNFALAMLSGVVHGLRLNFIEFYKWGLPDEGILFRPFAVKEIRE